MPAAPFSEASEAPPFAVRQWAIEPQQCRWIVAAEDLGADALMCGAPAERRRPFCAEHCAQAYIKLAPEEGGEAAEVEVEAVEEQEHEQEKEAE